MEKRYSVVKWYWTGLGGKPVYTSDDYNDIQTHFFRHVFIGARKTYCLSLLDGRNVVLEIRSVYEHKYLSAYKKRYAIMYEQRKIIEQKLRQRQQDIEDGKPVDPGIIFFSE
jgi:hypothetical protein